MLPSAVARAAGSGFVQALAVPAFVLLVAIVLWLGFVIVRYRDRRAQQASLARLLGRMPGWFRTTTPCGIAASVLAGRCSSTPRGDRRFGVRHGIDGPLPLSLDGHEVVGDASLFQWFCEQRSTSRSSDGAIVTTYRERRDVVGMLRLPVTSPSTVRIGSESLPGRIGLTRGGDQVESAAFNRRFRVEGDDRILTVQLLDANLQQVLLERYQGRRIDLDGDMLLLGGRPDRRDASLTGVVSEFPAVRQDLETLVAQIPAQFWRAIGVDQGVASDVDQGAASDVDQKADR